MNEVFDLSKIGFKVKLPLICVYKHPSDYPDKYVARLFDLKEPTDIMTTADTLEDIRLTKPPHMETLNRDPKDDPVIVEVWM